MNLFYVFIVPGPILRHLGEFGKIRLLPGENTHFFPDEVSMCIQKIGYDRYSIFFYVKFDYILAESRPIKLNISGDISIFRDFRQ